MDDSVRVLRAARRSQESLGLKGLIMARSANVAVLASLGVSVETMNQIPSNELALIADAILLARTNFLNAVSTAVAPVKRLPRNASLQTAMNAFGITNATNAKGDQLISYHPNRPKYPFVYRSARGARWKQTPEQAKRRFG
jgi:hypothetical protein